MSHLGNSIRIWYRTRDRKVRKMEIPATFCGPLAVHSHIIDYDLHTSRSEQTISHRATGRRVISLRTSHLAALRVARKLGALADWDFRTVKEFRRRAKSLKAVLDQTTKGLQVVK